MNWGASANKRYKCVLIPFQRFQMRFQGKLCVFAEDLRINHFVRLMDADKKNVVCLQNKIRLEFTFVQMNCELMTVKKAILVSLTR